AGLAIDLASRMARANPHLGADDLLAQTPGIVLIDEVDLHLHPTWQQEIVPTLRETFPLVQFILSTHSPQVIATVESANVRVLDGVHVRVPEYAYGLRPENILQEVQGTDPKPRVEVRKKLDAYLDAVYAGDGESEAALSQ
ncbi:AAA family ATPase, partial [Xanthomonas citri pv. citri]